MAPLEIDAALIEGFLPGPIGKWQDKLYSVGFYDAAVAMVTRKSILDKFGIRVPTLEEPWTAEEFDAALVKIKDSGEFEYPLDLGMAWTGRMVSLCLLPLPAELRRRHRRSRDLPGRPKAC